MFNRRMHQCLDEITDKRDVDMILVDEFKKKILFFHI